MKKLCVLFCLLLGLTACGGSGGGEGETSTSGPTVLTLDQEVRGTIATEGEVDWYQFEAVETNRTLNIQCQGTHHNSPVEFMVTAYDVDADGNLTPIIGRSAAEDAYPVANLQLKVRINGRRNLRIAVRDFKDDEAADRIPYELKVYYSNGDGGTDNSNFAQAVSMVVGSDLITDAIDEQGEVNCYTFQIAQDGVYRTAAFFQGLSSSDLPGGFNLGLELYNASGNLVHAVKGPRPTNLRYEILAFLSAGQYYLVVDDQGRNATYSQSYYVGVEAVDAVEANQNDSMDDSQTPPEDSEGYVLDGSLEYIQDQDWYVIQVPEDAGGNSYNLRLTFERGFEEVPESLSQLTVTPGYRVTVRDANGDVIYEFDRSVSAADPFDIEIGRREGSAHYVTVSPIFQYQLSDAMPYQLRVSLLEVSDEWESDTPIPLTPPQTVTGKIFKIGDVDDYTVSVAAGEGSEKVLEVIFDTAEPSEVEYVVNVSFNGVQRTLRDRFGNASANADGAHFKASYYFDAATTVSLQVGDDQNNSGSQVEYTLTVNVLDVPSTGPAVGAAATEGVSSPTFFGEAAEQTAASGTDVTIIEYNNHNQPVVKANTTLLRVGALDAENKWQSPWISGFVDYDGDRDIFELNFDDVPKGDQYYFDIKVQMVALATDVEYGWALFRDGGDPPNGQLLERTFWGDDGDGVVYDYAYNDSGEGVVAAWTDEDLAASTINKTVPDDDTDFWIGYRWAGSKFYLSVQDFNRTGLETVWDPTVGTEGATVQVRNPNPDNDWGYTAPYYFQVTVTLHDGEPNP